MESESIVFISPRASNPQEAFQEMVRALNQPQHAPKLTDWQDTDEQVKEYYGKHKHKSMWPWILLLALLGGLFWLLYRAARNTCNVKQILGQKQLKNRVSAPNPGKTIAFPGDTIDKFNSGEISTLQSLGLPEILGYFRKAPILSMEQKEILAPPKVGEWKLVDSDTQGADRQWIYNFPERNQRSQDHSWKIFYDSSNGWVLKDPVFSPNCNPSLPWYPQCANANNYNYNNNSYNSNNSYHHSDWTNHKWNKNYWSNDHNDDSWHWKRDWDRNGNHSYSYSRSSSRH